MHLPHAPLAGLYRLQPWGWVIGEKLISARHFHPPAIKSHYEAEKDGKISTFYRQYLDEDTARPIEGTEGGPPAPSTRRMEKKSWLLYRGQPSKVSSTTGVRQNRRYFRRISNNGNAIWGQRWIYLFSICRCPGTLGKRKGHNEWLHPSQETIATTRLPVLRVFLRRAFWRV